MPKSYFDWRHQYDPERDEFEGDLAAIATGSESLVQRSHRDDADINVLVRRFGIEGRMPATPPLDPRFYGDVDMVNDLGSALRVVKDANDKFMQLPADLRSRFNNDPGALWKFVTDPRNADEAVRLGLLKRANPPQDSHAGDSVVPPSGGSATSS